MKRIMKSFIAVAVGLSFVLTGVVFAQNWQGTPGKRGGSMMMGENSANPQETTQSRGYHGGKMRGNPESPQMDMQGYSRGKKGNRQGNFFNFLQQDMVSFDQAYIPALALTSQEKLAPSKKAMELLKAKWSNFKSTYYNRNIRDLSWKKDFDHVDELIAKADQIVQEGQNLKDAHEELEGIRIVFMELRKRNGLEYFVDDLTEFHEPMEGIVLAALNKTPETLTDEDINKIKTLLPQTRSLWEKIQKDSFDQKLFGFNDQKTTQLKTYLQAETTALDQLQAALEGTDKALVVKKSVAIKPNFAKLFMMFGDFEKVTQG